MNMGFFKFAFLAEAPTTRDDELQREVIRLREEVRCVRNQKEQAERVARSLARKILGLKGTASSLKPKKIELDAPSVPSIRPSVPSTLAPVPNVEPQTETIKLSSWLMVAVMVASSIGTVVLTVLDRDVPTVLTYGTSVPVGYFLGLLVQYLYEKGDWSV